MMMKMIVSRMIETMETIMMGLKALNKTNTMMNKIMSNMMTVKVAIILILSLEGRQGKLIIHDKMKEELEAVHVLDLRVLSLTMRRSSRM